MFTNVIGKNIGDSVLEILTSKTWSLSKVEFTYSGLNSEAPDSFMESCKRDNSFVFNKDGKCVLNAGNDTCSGAEKDLESTWALKNNESTISIGNKNYLLISIDDHTLKIQSEESYDTNGDGVVGANEKVNVVYTYTGR